MDEEAPDTVERRQRQFETLDRVAQRFGQSLSQAFARNAAEGQRLDTVLQSLTRSLANAGARAAGRSLGQLLAGALTGGSVEAFSRGGVVGGGRVRPFAAGGVVAAPTYFPLGRDLGLMGEAGPEAILPLARGADGTLGVRAGGGARAVSVTVNVSTPDAESFRRSEAQVSAALARAVARGRRAL